MSERTDFVEGLSLMEYMRLQLKRKYGSQARAAEALGISQAMISGVLRGTKRATPAILAVCGLERRVTYVRISQETA